MPAAMQPAASFWPRNSSLTHCGGRGVPVNIKDAAKNAHGGAHRKCFAAVNEVVAVQTVHGFGVSPRLECTSYGVFVLSIGVVGFSATDRERINNGP